MTVSSKSTRLPGTSSVVSGNVVELPMHRSSSTARSIGLNTRTNRKSAAPVSATLLSVRQHLRCKASIGIDNLEFIEQSYSKQVAAKLLGELRELLDQEFGGLRVHRRRHSFIVNHHCVESLIAGLLRVQFHSQTNPLPATREEDGSSDVRAVFLSWGVGTTVAEAKESRTHKGQL